MVHLVTCNYGHLAGALLWKVYCCFHNFKWAKTRVFIKVKNNGWFMLNIVITLPFEARTRSKTKQ